MSRLIDITGMVFGKLVVLKRVGSNKHNKATWLCGCGCGNTTIVVGVELTSGGTKSCGCLKNQTSANFKDITGQQFNRLTVIKRMPNSIHGHSQWLCRCDCGNEIIVSKPNLLGKTKSCGCLRIKNNKSRSINLVGKKFNMLTVVSKHGRDKKDKITWRCKCECGQEKIIRGESLTSGKLKSCGCLRNRKGKDNPGYNPNLTAEDRVNRRKIPGYTEWTQAVYERDNYMCQVCGKIGGLNAHHLESYNSNKPLRTTLSNGITMCVKCHKDFHHQYGYGDNSTGQYKEFKNAFKLREQSGGQ